MVASIFGTCGPSAKDIANIATKNLAYVALESIAP